MKDCESLENDYEEVWDLYLENQRCPNPYTENKLWEKKMMIQLKRMSIEFGYDLPQPKPDQSVTDSLQQKQTIHEQGSNK